MYIVPLIVIIVIALLFFFSPILSVALLILALVALGIFKFLGPGTEPEHAAPPGRTVPPSQTGTTASVPEEETGAWGERWPEEEGAGQEPSP